MLKNPVMLELIFRTDTPVTENYFVFVIGITTGLIAVDGAVLEETELYIWCNKIRYLM